MTINPDEHPLHKAPDDLPHPQGDLSSSKDEPIKPPELTLPDLAQTEGGELRSYVGEVENENADPVGRPPRL